MNLMNNLIVLSANCKALSNFDFNLLLMYDVFYL